MSWAQIAAGKHHKNSGAPKKPQAVEKPIHRIPVMKPTVQKFNELERRTQVLRKVPPGTTTTSILNDLKQQCVVDLTEVIEAVVQEPLDRRRFYIRYRSVEQKRTNARRGFKIGTIDIPPEKADVKGFIPDLPHYMEQNDVVEILSQYGAVVATKFRTFEDTDIRCGGLEFELDLHENMRLPGKIHILNDTFTLHLKDDIKLCTYCDKYGHIHRDCRKKKDDMTKKNNKDLEELNRKALAEAEEQNKDSDMDDQSDEYTSTEDEEEDSEQTPISTPSQISEDQPLPQTSDQIYTTPTISTQPIVFVSGGALSTASTESYETPTQQSHLTPQAVAATEEFYATEDDNPFRSATYTDLYEEEKKISQVRCAELYNYHNPKGRSDAQLIKNIAEAAKEAARVQMTEKYRSIYEQFFAEKTLRAKAKRSIAQNSNPDT